MPLISPPPPPVAPRRRRRRRKQSKKPMVEVETRNWAELPLDAILHIFHKLDWVELLTGGAAEVCRSWRHAARDQPELWRRIDTRHPSPRVLRRRVSFNRMAWVALWLSAGQCEAFWGESDAVDDDLLLFLAEQAPSLKSLHLITCYCVSTEAFVEAIKKLPLLEELELTLCYLSLNCPGVIGHVAKACPQLKHFIHVKEKRYRTHIYECHRVKDREDREATAIANMHELRSLQLFRDNLTNEGLTAIVDGCPRLESLDLRSCCNVDMDGDLRAKCASIKTKTLHPYDNIDDCEDFQPGSPISYCSTCYGYSDIEDRFSDFSGIEDGHDYSDHSCDLGEVNETDLEEYGMVLDKGMRRYLKI